MEKITSFKELLVWQKGIAIVKEVYLLMKKLPEAEKFGLVQQAKRSAVSIPANIAEGWGRRSTKNYLQFLRIASGSLYELETHSIVSVELRFLSEEDCRDIFRMIEEEGKMLNALMSKLEQKLIQQ